MTLSIRTLPIEERWDCHACGNCCRGTNVALSDQDVQRLREQGWHEHPDFRDLRIVERRGRVKKGHRLVHRPDGTCVFLTPEGRCRIHQDYGEPAKPLVCRTFPFQLVPLDDFACLTLRRYCPSAAADRGRKLKDYVSTVRKLAEQRPPQDETDGPPAVTRGHRRSWKDTLRITDAIERLMLDTRYPPVRRLVHGLQFCKLLDLCRLHKLSSERLEPLLGMLEVSAVEEAKGLFQGRRPPSRAAAGLFRQSAFEYVRLHPKFGAEQSWRERFRLMRTALAYARGKGRVPPIHPDFPETTFKALERPLGHLGAEVLAPLGAFFEAATASRHYALPARRKWAVVESFRALAMAFPVAMWLLRLGCGDRPPTVDDVIDVVGTIDRGLSFGSLVGRRHRTRVRVAARLGELTRLVVWYAR